ncbi:hypothetical protein Tco_1469056, partial [Tanacetum coccineum]
MRSGVSGLGVSQTRFHSSVGGKITRGPQQQSGTRRKLDQRRQQKDKVGDLTAG